MSNTLASWNFLAQATKMHVNSLQPIQFYVWIRLLSCVVTVNLQMFSWCKLLSLLLWQYLDNYQVKRRLSLSWEILRLFLYRCFKKPWRTTERRWCCWWWGNYWSWFAILILVVHVSGMTRVVWIQIRVPWLLFIIMSAALLHNW